MNRSNTFLLGSRACVQALSLSSASITGGGFTITIPSVGTTASITTLSASAIQTAIRALAGMSTVVVAAVGTTNYFTITFADGVAVGAITIPTNTLTNGGTPVTVTPSVLQTGVSGTTPITTIAADASMVGDTVTFIATMAGVTMTNGSNLKLAADWVSSAAYDSITLTCDGTNWVERGRKSPAPSGSLRRIVAAGAAIWTPSDTAAVYTLRPGQTTTPQKMTSASAYGVAGAFYLDPADLAESGRSVKFRLEADLLANATAPASSFLAALWQISAVAGAVQGNILPTVSEITAIRPTAWTAGTVTANHMERRRTATAQTLSAGWYAMGVTLASTPMTTNSAVQVTTRLVAELV